VNNVELWYPAGYGQQTLYPMDVSAKGPSGSSDEKKLTVGFRKVELRTDEVPNGV
jgi:beta-galactosidase/beta-glucuronidase